MGSMPRDGMNSRPKLAEKARYNSLLKITKANKHQRYSARMIGRTQD